MSRQTGQQRSDLAAMESPGEAGSSRQALQSGVTPVPPLLPSLKLPVSRVFSQTNLQCGASAARSSSVVCVLTLDSPEEAAGLMFSLTVTASERKLGVSQVRGGA